MKTKLLITLISLVLVAAAQAQTYTEKILYSFASIPNDGGAPTAGLVMDSAGNLYGTTAAGGNSAASAGVIFKIDKNGNGYTILHYFNGTTDGAGPNQLTMDKSGNLFGTTSDGGMYTKGTVFEFTAGGVFSTLYNFGAFAQDGQFPQGPVTLDSAGNMYGTTFGGGFVAAPFTCLSSGCGTVFRLTPNGVETILHKFTGGGDGCNPVANVVRDKAGNLYGTALACGPSIWGTVFKLTSGNVESTLYQFCPNQDCTNGWGPSFIARDSQGNLYVACSGGGMGGGTIFELTSANVPTLVYSYPGPPYRDGEYPGGTFLLSGGDLYGAAGGGGLYATSTPGSGGGTVYKMTTSGLQTMLHSYPVNSPTDGEYPNGGLVMDSVGNFYGTTFTGGQNFVGMVFELIKQ